MPTMQTWHRPTFAELRYWARTSAKRWYHQYLTGLVHYGTGFKGDPLVHAAEENRDITSYLAHAEARTQHHIKLISQAASDLLEDDPELRMMTSHALVSEVIDYFERLSYHKDWDTLDQDTYQAIRNMPEIKNPDLPRVVLRNIGKLPAYEHPLHDHDAFLARQQANAMKE